MTTKLEQAARQALEALEQYHYTLISAGVLDKQHVLNQGFTAHAALREALEQPTVKESLTADISGRITDCLLEDHVALMAENASLREALAEQAEQEPVCECHRKTSAVISSERDL